MKKSFCFALGVSVLCFSPIVSGQGRIADVLGDPTIDFSRPADRARAVERIRLIENAGLERARAKAVAMGIPMRRVEANGVIHEIVGVDENGELIEYITHNANAAISSAANLVYPAPYSLSGAGVRVGVWDAGAVRNTHREFSTGSRVTIMDGAAFNNHGTHVGGTIGAIGVTASAKGMAPAVLIDSYDWSSDASEMLSRGATQPGQADRISISNHSYGNPTGWIFTNNVWTWNGTGTNQNAYAPLFGMYHSLARTWDDVSYKSPYYLIFKSAGNENSNNPGTGTQVSISGSLVTYDPSIHPPGDGVYRNGFETITTSGIAKNIVTVGAANDAVTNGLRDPAKSTITGFSSRGPTDDGRIKPDLVANGASLYSTSSGGDSSYTTMSGTSMSSPSAAGSAALLVEQYGNLFPGGAMRASTLKGLLIHTATDLGNPGPDYTYGWGLMNVKEAADLIVDHHANPLKRRMIEDQVSTSVTSRTYSFAWDGSSPIRATLCWTDPPGDSTGTHDLRTARLKNDLNLKLIAPNGNEYFPFVMPFVGTWTVASMSLPATTGINNRDPVEQVLIQNPGQTGTWQAVVTYSGILTNNLQNYGLLFSGVSDGVVPLVLNDITPDSGNVGSIVTVDIGGTVLSEETEIRLRRSGRADIIGSSRQMINATTLRCQFDLSGAASGLWDLVATNTDTETFTLTDAFTISGSLSTIWSESFDSFPNGAVGGGWTSSTSTGSNSWAIVSSPNHPSHSPSKSCYVTGPSNTSVTYLSSPQIAIPADASNLQLEFWHQHDINTRHGGRFSMSIDNGAWFDVTDSGSGAAFTAGGYNSTVVSQGQTSAFADLQAWTGVSSGFVRTTISLNDVSKYGGRNLRLRWGIATNRNQTSAHWYVDSIALTSDSSESNQGPAIIVAATTDTEEFETVGSITYHVLRGTDTNLAVTATDDSGEGSISYSWSASGPGVVAFTLNESNAAKTTTAGFSSIGDYAITVTATDTGGLFVSSTVDVRVLATGEFVLSPESVIVNVDATQQFSATVIDQFGTPLASQPSPIGWSASGGGTISEAGLFNATSIGGPFIITASGGGESGTAEVSINPTVAGIELHDLEQIYAGNLKIVTAITSPVDLNYMVTYNGQASPPTNAGSYEVVGTITDPNYEGVASGVLVIGKASQVITFDLLADVGDDHEAFALTAAASSGLAVSYVSSAPAVASISGNMVTLNGIGTTTISASQAGDDNHFPATDVQRTLTVLGPVNSFVISMIGSPQTIGTTINGITVTALDESGAVASSFGGTVTFGGTGGFSGTSTPFLGGVLSGLSITPTVAGSDLTFTVDDGEGHVGSVSIVKIESLFENWARISGLEGEDAAPDANPDGDKLTNLQEFAFGADSDSFITGPLVFELGGEVLSVGLPTLVDFQPSAANPDTRAVFIRRKDYQLAGLRYVPQFSADMLVWTTSQTPPTVLTDQNGGAQVEAVSVPFPAAVSVAGEVGPLPPKFFRLGVVIE